MNNSPLEFLAKKYGNVVKYDADGNVAGIFVKFPKMKSSDLVAGLPEHTHPAFIINGVEQDYILLGKYKGGENGVSGGALVSLPNINPARTLGADQCLSRMKLAGPGITGMTCADYGFIKLLAQKNGCIDNMRLIQGAVTEALFAGKEPTASDIYGPQGFLKSKPKCPANRGGPDYEIPTDDETAPTCPNVSDFPEHVLPPD